MKFKTQQWRTVFYFTAVNDKSLNGFKVSAIYQVLVVNLVSICLYFFLGHKVVVIITHILKEI